MRKRVLLLLGGTYHDFEGFRASITPVIEQLGHTVEATYTPDRLTGLADDSVDVLLQYTCLGNTDQKGKIGVELTWEQTEGLTRWVRAGGGLLSVHSATVISEGNPDLARLHGGRFLEHPPQFSFLVVPLSRPHPITVGIEAFSVFDELYKQEVFSDSNVHMVAMDRGVAHPMVWTRTEGRGRVAHVSPGHGERVWTERPYRVLMRQALEWVAGER